MATEKEAKRVRKELDRLLVEIDLLEEMWGRLPEKVRQTNRELADRLEKLPLMIH